MYVTKLSLRSNVGVNGVGRRHVKSRECMLLYRLTQLLYESKIRNVEPLSAGEMTVSNVRVWYLFLKQA